MVKKGISSIVQYPHSKMHSSSAEPYTGRHSMIGTSPQMETLYERIERFGPLDMPVLIRGASGTGKRMVADAIYEAYKKEHGSDVPLIAVYGEADSINLFSRPDSPKRSVLLVNEVWELNLGLQATVLKILKENERLAQNAAKVVATTQVMNGPPKSNYNRSLFSRLSEVILTVPELSKRTAEDIELLARHFFNHYAALYQKEGLELTQNALTYIIAEHPWPQNVTGLKNFMSKAIESSNGSQRIDGDFLGMLEDQDVNLSTLK